MTVEAYISGINQATNLLRNGRLAEAERMCQNLISSKPERVGGYLVLSQIYLNKKEYKEAEKVLEKGIEWAKDEQLHLSMGILKSKQAAYREALESFREINMDLVQNAGALFNYARALVGGGNIEKGIKYYQKVLKSDPNHKASLNNLANIFQKRENFQEAIKLYQRLIKNYPDEAMGFCNLGSLYEKLNQLEKTLECYERAVKIDPKLSIAYYNLSHLYAGKLNNHQKALGVIEEGLEKSAGEFSDGLRFQQIVSRQQIVDWSNYEADLKDLEHILRRYIANEHPVFEVVPYNLSYSKIDNQLYRLVAEKYANSIALEVETQYPNTVYNHGLSTGKIKIGYYSPNFKVHPGGLLVRKLFDYHESAEFEIHAFSLVQEDDFVNKEIQETVDYYHDVSKLSSLEIADLINRTGIDILVALAGYNTSMKMEVLALRPAPIQMEVIGSHETTGAPFIDYVFSDAYMMDEELRKNFSENVITLPCSLLLNSELPTDKEIQTSRSDHGLPETGFVFAAFNHPKKLDPETFSSWMEILKKCPDSVLWFYNGGSNHVEGSILRNAEKMGIASGRIVFAGPMLIKQHWERFQHADLFLDNFIYNAHVTAIEALRLGKPIISISGNNHNSRLCASLLYHVGLENLICQSKKEYEELALHLYNQPKTLLDISEKLDGKELNVLFDSRIQIKYLEKAYKMALASYIKYGQFKDLIVKSLLKFDSFY